MKLWITCTDKDEDAKCLESFGVVLGRDDQGNLKWEPDAHADKAHGVAGRGTFHDCEVSDDALDKLNPLWMHHYIWGPEAGHAVKLPNIHEQQYEMSQKAGEKRRLEEANKIAKSENPQ